jgi:hypothetical protein
MGFSTSVGGIKQQKILYEGEVFLTFFCIYDLCVFQLKFYSASIHYWKLKIRNCFFTLNYYIMNTKKLLSLSVIMFSLVFLAGCGKSTTTIPTVTTDPTAVTDTTTTTPENTRDLTQKECIELVAYAFKAAQYQAQ